MTDKRINIAVLLSAQDQMSAKIAAAVTASIGHLNRFKDISQKMASFGAKSMAAGFAAAAPLAAFAKAYGDQEASYISMKTSMMTDGNKVNQAQLDQLDAYTQKSIALYGSSKAANMDMATEMLNNGAKVKDILSGMGDGVNQLAVAFNIAPVDAAQFAARVQRDMHIASSEIPAFMDNINRLHMIGVGKTGSEAVTEMSAAYSKVGLAASVLGPKAEGLKGANDLGATMAIFIKRGFSGELVGTNFYKILMGMTNADKMKKVNETLFGLTSDHRQLQFFDEKGQFAGYTNMVSQLDKLKGLSVTQISSVLRPFANKSGPIAGILASLSEHGTEGFNENQKAIMHKPLLTDINKQIMGGLNKQAQVTKNLAVAAAANIGKTYTKNLKEMLHYINLMITAVTTFTNKHQTLTKVIMLTAGAFSVAAIAGGGLSVALGGVTAFAGYAGTALKITMWAAIRLGQGFLLAAAYVKPLAMQLLMRGIPAMASWTAAAWANTAAWLANPIVEIVLGIIAVIALMVAIGILVYKNWDSIMNWFSKQWVLMKASVSGVIEVFKLFWQVVEGVGKAVIGLFTFDPKMMVAGAKEAADAVNKIANGGISNAFMKGASDSIKASGVRFNANGDMEKIKPVKPVMVPVVHNHNVTNNVNLHGIKTDDPKAFGDKIEHHLKKLNAKQVRLNQK